MKGPFFGLTTALWLLAITLAMPSSTLNAQSAPGRYWVQFIGKTHLEVPDGHETPYRLDAPEEYLGERALVRRAKQEIEITESDLPIPPTYLESLYAISSIKVILKSRWFNAVTVSVADTTFDVQSLLELPFVTGIKSVVQISNEPDGPAHFPRLKRNELDDASSYGPGWLPLEQLNAHWLHSLGFTGQGMWIGVLDAGFENADNLPIFQKARNEGRIHDGMDAMYSQGGLYAHHRHGTMVLGTMAGYLPDSLIGTAPMANYVLYRTEDAYSEYLIEEDYWVVAAEHADSIGVDLINTSLGYSTFDDSTMNHTVDDLNGTTARISQAMTWAAEKGILCVTSAGNSGNSEWHAITAPADAHGILAVGAIQSSGLHANFSGFGPSADARIKPEVMALGVQVTYPHADSTFRMGNGTSFASPIMCGSAACLWQAFPDATASEIRAAIIGSAHLFDQPNDSMGYGIPDFQGAYEILDTGGAADWLQPVPESENLLRIFPNPGSNIIRWVHRYAQAPDAWRIVNTLGREVGGGSITSWRMNEESHSGWIQISSNASAGMYVFELMKAGETIATTRWVSQVQ